MSQPVDEAPQQPPYQQPGYPPGQGPPPKKSSNAIIVVAVLAVVAVPVLGIFASLAIYGVSRYVKQSKQAEARAFSGMFARGITTCGKLPPTSTPVPAEVPQGAKYQSAPDDWNQPAHTCAKFSVSSPQFYSYQWVKESEDSGHVVAKADLDGDGEVDSQVEMDVTCSAGMCSVGVSRVVVDQ